MFDETTLKQVKKQLDVTVSYHSTEKKPIQHAYLDSVFVSNATADILRQSTYDVLKYHRYRRSQEEATLKRPINKA